MGEEGLTAAADRSARGAGFMDATARREFALISAAALLLSLTSSHASLMAFALQRSGYTLSQIGVLLGSMAITTVLFTLLAGAMVTRFGAVRSAQIAMVASSLGILSLVWTLNNFWGALASRLLWGAGVGLFLPSSMVYLQSRLNTVRFVYLVTVFSAMVPIAQAIAPSIGEFVLDRFGVRAMFIEGAIPSAVGLLLTIPLRPLARPTVSGRLEFRSSFQRRYLLPVIGLLAGGTVFGYAVAYIGSALAERSVSLSWFFLASTAAMIGGRLGASRLITRLEPPVTAGCGLLVSCVSLVLAAFANSPWMAALAGAALGAGNSVMYPVLSSWMSTGLSATQRAGVQSLAATAFYFGIYATPFPQSLLIAALGYVGTQFTLAAAGTATGLTMIVIGRSGRT